MNSDKYFVTLVPPTLIEYTWPKAVPHLQRILAHDRGEVNLDVVKQKAMRAEVNLFLVTEGEDVIGAITTEFKVFDSGKMVLYVPMLAADFLDDWIMAAIEYGKKFAKSVGCTEIRGTGARKGWVKMLKQYGFEEAYVTVSLDI